LVGDAAMQTTAPSASIWTDDNDVNGTTISCGSPPPRGSTPSRSTFRSLNETTMRPSSRNP
jgi:hypothetical protein